MAMRALFRLLVLLPFALLLLGFSLANRNPVTVSIDPFSSGDGLPTFSIPLYFLFLGAMMLGVVIGGSSTWMSQSRHRKAAREASRKSAALKAENDALRKQGAPNVSSLPASRQVA
jgi:uncharacterized integral membrane protein